MRITTALLATMLLIAVVLPVRGADDDHEHAATQPTTAEFEVISKDLGLPGTLKDGVYTVSLTRDDLDVQHEDGQVPAGVLKTEFQFFRCDCGKMSVVGQFCLADYESNDVIDALRGGMLKVASVSPMLMGEHPRVLIVRFQGSGGSQQLAKTLKNALEWTGEARMAPTTRSYK